MSRMRRQADHQQEQQAPASLESIVWSLNQADRLLSHGSSLISEEWLLVASNLAGAYNDLATYSPEEIEEELRLLDQVMSELEAVTGNFTNVHFLRSTRAARRKAPVLFQLRS